MGESWIVSNLNAALSTWNDKLAEIWSLLTESPQTFKGGQVWGVMTSIHSALQAIGYGLLVLFFAVGVMKTCGSFVEVKKPEHALKLFIRFALAKGAVTYGLELMLAVFSIVQGMVSTIITQSGSSGMSSVSLPQELIDAINNVGFWDSIPPVGGYADWRAAHNRAVIYDDPDGLRQNVQSVDVRRNRADSTVHLCG